LRKRLQDNNYMSRTRTTGSVTLPPTKRRDNVNGRNNLNLNAAAAAVKQDTCVHDRAAPPPSTSSP
jgi:hypothetical protein